MTIFTQAFGYLFDGANWSGPTGIAARLFEQIWYSFLAVF